MKFRTSFEAAESEAEAVFEAETELEAEDLAGLTDLLQRASTLEHILGLAQDLEKI
jgi:hypothetical protein